MESKEIASSSTADALFRALVIAALIFAALCALLLAILVPLLGAIMIVLVFITTAVITMVARNRETRRESTLWALAIAVKQGMPIAQAFQGLAEDAPERYAVKLRRVGNLLNTGAPLPDALTLTPATLPRSAEPIIRAGWETGRVSEALDRASTLVMAQQPQRGAIISRFTYLSFVLIVMQLIVFFLLYFIMPKYEAIFRDFGQPLPRITQVIIGFSHFAVVQSGPIFMLTIVAEILCLLAGPLILTLRWRQGLPVVDRFLARKHGMTILRVLAWDVDAGQPLSRGIASLSRHYPSSWVRDRLELVLQDLGTGEDCWRSLENRSLLRAVDRTLLDSAKRVGNLSWALRELADSGERRFDYYSRIWLQSFSMLAVLCLGLLALIIALTYFSPLVAMLNALAVSG